MKIKMPPTAKRVAYHTNPVVNRQIRDQTIARLKSFKERDSDAISDQIQKLNCEWDTERLLEANAAAIVVLTAAIGAIKKSRCCFFVSGLVGSFLLLHALQGWCPPVPVIRKMGVRTAEEINNEITALKVQRGDFSQESADVSEVLDLVEKQ